MLNIHVPKGTEECETRVPLCPQAVKRLTALGASVSIAPGMGLTCGWGDQTYEDAGAEIREDGLDDADVVVGLEVPGVALVNRIKPGALFIGYLDPFNQPALIDALAARPVDAIAMEMIPRTTLAQKMDALSSQANLAGYVAVLEGATRIPRIVPMMMTPSGTLKPARVFVIGVGVAGLQAIATAKRLGARVEAFDTRPAVEEQVQSLGAKFVKVDLGETGETRDGYARALTDEQRLRQQEAMADVVAASDLVITTAQVFGRRAPVIVTDAMIQRMRPGSVIVDGAVDSGGNVEGIEAGQVTTRHGVILVARPHLSRQVPVHASEMYGANIAHLLEHFWDREAGALHLDPSNEIVAGCQIVRDGALCNERLRDHRENA